MKLNRREFLKTAGAFAASAQLPAAFAAEPAGSRFAASTVEGWFNRPMRWAQLTLVENDPGQFDIAFWLDYFKKTHSDAACLSAGGVVAFYPTDVPLHHRSAWLGSHDPFGELVAGCRKLGMAVVARTDSHAVHQPVMDAHPDWIAVDASGKKRRHWASPEMWVTCALGPYNFEHMTKIHREIMALYGVDGVFINRWDGSGMCYCEHCRRQFKEASGFDLPKSHNPRDGAWREYHFWRQQRLFDLWQLWETSIRDINPESRVIPNTGGGALSDLDMKRIGDRATTLMADRQARRGVTPPWAAGKNGKEYRATLGAKPVVGIFSVGLEEPYRWKDSVQSDAEIRIWVADAVANGMRPWFTKFAGSVRDPRWLGTVERFYSTLHRIESYLRNVKPLSRIAMVYSQQTAWFYAGPQARQKVEDHALGFYHALVEARLPFEMVHDQLLDAEALRPFKTLILPNIAALSDAQCDQLRQFVHSGGSLVATFETSLYDESGERRKNFGLADLFGADAAGNVEGPMRNSYLALDPSAGTDGEQLFAGLENAPRIVNGVHRLPVTPNTTDSSSPLRLIPSYPDLPMEKVFPPSEKAGDPQVFIRRAGAGQVIYFPWDIDRTFWEILSVDHGKLLENAVRLATQEEPPATVSGPGLVDVTVWRQKQSLTVHIVNLTNPMAMKGPFRELIPLSGQKVRIKLPPNMRPVALRLLIADRALQMDIRDGAIEAVLPPILDHEIVAVDLA